MNSTPQSTSSGVVQVEACIHLKALRCKSLCTINFIVFWKSLGRASGQSCVSCAGAGGCDYSAGEGGCDHIAGAGCCDSHRDGARCWGWGWGSCEAQGVSNCRAGSVVEVDAAEKAHVTLLRIFALLAVLVADSDDTISLCALITIHHLALEFTKCTRCWLEQVTCGAGGQAAEAIHTVKGISGCRSEFWGCSRCSCRCACGHKSVQLPGQLKL